MSDGKFAVLCQHHCCVYQSRQLGRSGVTSTGLHGKENSVHHQIRFHSVVVARVARPRCDFRDGSGDVDGYR